MHKTDNKKKKISVSIENKRAFMLHAKIKKLHVVLKELVKQEETVRKTGRNMNLQNNIRIMWLMATWKRVIKFRGVIFIRFKPF